MVLDDAIVDEGNPFTGKVRMGIVGGRCAMGRPTGVGDAESPAEGLDADLFLKFGDTGGAAGALEASLAVDGDAAGVIAPVFQPFQPFQHDWHYITFRNCTDYTAHPVCSFILGYGQKNLFLEITFKRVGYHKIAL
jgi:hypothetical protein